MADRTGADGVKAAKAIEELRREAARRVQGYRERALRILPHVCASCGREFEGRRLKELTVHHKDHNHDNNPPDGGNWELLCLYCHEFEHEKGLSSAMRAVAGSTTDRSVSGTFQPLAGLGALLGGASEEAAGPAPKDPDRVRPAGGAREEGGGKTPEELRRGPSNPAAEPARVPSPASGRR